MRRKEKRGLTPEEVRTTERVLRIYLEQVAGIGGDIMQGISNAELRDAVHKTLILCEALREFHNARA